MRLAQLARKVGKNQSEVIKFLEDNSVFVEDHSNAKVEDTDVAKVMNHFAPAVLAPIQEPERQSQALAQEPETTLPEVINELALGDQEVVEVSPDATAIEKQTEVIKAPKIALQGLKVIGKIDLPEIKKKVTDNEDKQERQVPKEFNSKQERRTSSRQRPAKNPIALQREKEEQEKQKKKLEKIAYLKELKTQRYLSKVRRPIDIYKESKQESPILQTKSVTKITKPEKKSTSIIARFIKWLLNR
jgi:hypothetical protein